MKILMLGWELPPHHTGGMGVVCLQLCKALASQSADIEFVLPYSADFPTINFMKVTPAMPTSVEEVLRQSGGTYDSQYFSYLDARGNTRGVNMAEHQDNYVKYVSQLALLGEYDVIHAHDWLTFRAGLAAKHISGKPLIVHIHSTEFDRSGGNSGNPLVREIEYLGLHLADKIIAVSQATKDIIVREYDIDPSRISVVHNAIEFNENELYETGSSYKYIEYMKTQGYKVILSAGRLTVQKGLTNLLHAAKEVVERNPKTLFLVVGSGEQYQELIRLAADLGISQNVIMVGYINGTGKQWRDAFRCADLFVMPSISEPFGLTPIEAITFGAPVLISKQTGVSEVLKNCFKVDFWDIHEMANQMCAAITYPNLKEEIYRNAQAELKKIAWNKSIDKIMDIYNKQLQRVAV